MALSVLVCDLGSAVSSGAWARSGWRLKKKENKKERK
jgi:hypothetical protein